MMRIERRQTPRMKVDGFAYVTLDPDNGGMVSDISEGGLSFQSTTPVERTARIRFWFSQRKYQTGVDGRMACTRFLEADSELAWTDETRKRGGLRFTSLAKGDREEIRAWISQHSMPIPNEKESAPSVRSSRESPFASANRRDASAKRGSLETLQLASPGLQAPRPLTGFAGGLASGVLFSAIIATGVLVHNYSRELGDSLVQLGERIGGKSRPEALSPTAKPEAAEAKPMPSELPAPLRALEPEAPVRTRFPERERLPSRPAETGVKPQGVKLVAGSQATPTALPAAKANASATETISPPKLSAPTPAIGAEGPADSSSAVLRPVVPPVELAHQPEIHVESSKEVHSGSPAEEYLEVGKFNDKLRASKTTDKLGQFGFPFVVVTKSFIWKKSYQILAGPYGSDHEAELAHADLASHGFAARPFEKGKREVTLRTALTLGGSGVPVGDCVIRWESYIPYAIVKIEGPEGATVTLEGKLVSHADRYNQDAVVYTRNLDGSRTLNEFRFSGMRQAIVFGTEGTSKRF
jgi:hypothetical protein